MFTFTPFRRLQVKKDRNQIAKFFKAVAVRGSRLYRSRVLGGPKTGRTYSRRGGVHQASRVGEYPANDTGAFRKSISGTSTRQTATVGSSAPHAKFLHGTSKMGPRKMSQFALGETVPLTRRMLGRAIRFERG